MFFLSKEKLQAVGNNSFLGDSTTSSEEPNSPTAKHAAKHRKKKQLMHRKTRV